ncbi:MAG: hypothetical protein AB1646_04280 [Thermodesulfobacteriota bacterium]
MRTVSRIAVALVVALGPALFAETAGLAQESFHLSPNAKFIFGMEWGYAWLSGQFLIPAGGRPGSGTRVDVPTELGSTRGETTAIFCQGEIAGRHLLGGTWFTASPTAERTVTNEFRFHNKTYESGSVVESKLDFHWFDMGYGIKLLDLETWWIAPKMGVHHIRHALTINGETAEAGLYSNTRALDGTYPVVGLEGRFFLPLNFDMSVQVEGVHLITRGFLSSVRLGGYWRVYPDVVVTMGAFNRQVHYLEDNQQLNNEWFYSIWGGSAGISFTF